MKNGKKLSDLWCKMTKVKVVSKDVGAKENGNRAWTPWKYYPAHPRIKLWKMHIWPRISCWGRSIEVKLTTKVWSYKKNSSCRFSQLPLKKCLSWIHFSLCQVAPLEGAKQNTIGVTRGANAELPHHKGPMPTCLMKKEMSLIHYVSKDVIIQSRTMKT